MSASNEWLWWLLGALASVGVLVYAVFEYLKWVERTQVYQLATGLSFVAHGFQVETHRASKKILVKTGQGQYTQAATESMPAQEKAGALQVSLSALGLRMDVTPVMREAGQGATADGVATQVPTGQCSIRFDNSDEKTTVIIPHVSAKVGQAFAEFARPIAVWIDKLEERRAKEEAAKPKPAEVAEDQAAAEAAAEAKDSAINTELTTEAQVAQWRKSAGFTGTSSDIGLDDKGKIVWFIDLDPTGRIILHSERRTAFSNLLGAEFVSLGGELEVTVRDTFWTEAEPEMQSFRVLKGRSPDERRAWKERLEILRGESQTAAKKA
jgi:hypothetical protein